VKKTFAPFFARRGTVLAITGNHDRDGKINMVRAGMTLAAPAAGAGAELTPGRMYLLNGRAVASLAGVAGHRVQFVMVPYPFRSRYDLPAVGLTSLEEEHRQLHDAVAAWVREAADKPGFDKALPTVLAAHLHVRGAEVHNLYRMTDRDDVLFDFADLNPMWAYVALGHIHKPQALNGQGNVRYPGSLDRLDFGETHDDHGVLLLEVGPTGLVGDPVRLPIPATPFHTVTIEDPAAELDGLADKYPDRETAIFRVTVTRTPPTMSRDEVVRDLRKLFPRLHELKWGGPDAEAEAGPSSVINPRAGFETTVRDWLTERFKDDPDRVELMALAEKFLKDGGAA
jgi:exonuclease SbcD